MRIIAGPCQHESLEHSLSIARECKRVCDEHGIEYIFKASYDKANRTSFNGIRGQGIDSTLSDFRKIKDELDVATLTDVHDIHQIQIIHEQFDDAVDVLQIPAFLCRQTDLIRAAVDTDKVVNIKKGQFLAPGDVNGIMSKTHGAKEVWITERGTSFGYGRLVNDFTGMLDLLGDHGSKFVYDVTHSVQRPGGNGTSSGGNRDYVPALCRAGAAIGVTSFFLEVHPDPDSAPSDGANMLHLDDFETVVKDIVRYAYREKETVPVDRNYKWWTK